MIKYRLKAIDSIIKGKIFKEPSLIDFPFISFKNASIEYTLKNTTDYVRSIILNCPIQNQHKNILVDIKVHYLIDGDIPALPFWHMDGINKFNYEKEDLNHIFVSGNICLTEFLSEEQDIEVENGPINFNKLIKVKGQKIEGDTIYSYGRHVHRATPAIGHGFRLLVRVSETNLRPKALSLSNKLFKVT